MEFSDVVHSIYIIFASENIKSTKSTISDGDCENIADFPVQTQREHCALEQCTHTNIAIGKEEHIKDEEEVEVVEKKGMKNSARNQYTKWISFYRSYKN